MHDPDRCHDVAVIALIVVAAVVIVALGAGLLGLFGWSVSRDVREREREGTDPEDLNWRARYNRGYPPD